uniref:hypothetical protein n=1 Tax=Roseivirga sp. TaxID=1964215 RepID=UPI004048C30B
MSRYVDGIVIVQKPYFGFAAGRSTRIWAVLNKISLNRCLTPDIFIYDTIDIDFLFGAYGLEGFPRLLRLGSVP